MRFIILFRSVSRDQIYDDDSDDDGADDDNDDADDYDHDDDNNDIDADANENDVTMIIRMIMTPILQVMMVIMMT